MLTFVRHLRAISQYRMCVCVRKEVDTTSHLLGYTRQVKNKTFNVIMAFRCWSSIYDQLLHSQLSSICLLQ